MFLFHLRKAFFAALLRTPEEAGLMVFRILKIFQAVPAQCPAVASTSPVASPALSPNLCLKYGI